LDDEVIKLMMKFSLFFVKLFNPQNNLKYRKFIYMLDKKKEPYGSFLYFIRS